MERFRKEYGRKLAVPMKACERLLTDICGRPGGLLGEAGLSTFAAGGKRLRPLLVFLCHARGRPAGEASIAAAAAVELVHTATLIHDDVIDEARLRRGQPTLMAVYGPDASTAVGDYLFAAAFDLLASTGSAAATGLLSRGSLGLSRGELRQMAAARDYSLDVAAYTERCRLKTASLFAVACRLGVIFSQGTPPAADALERFGECLGLAFQITDDILDLAGDAAQTGKTAGTDLRDGTVTLPVILALREDPSLAAALAVEPDENGVAELCRRIEATGGLAAARKVALGYIDEAEVLLAAVTDEVDTAPLSLIAAAMVDRIS